jgi:hypothetical protein
MFTFVWNYIFIVYMCMKLKAHKNSRKQQNKNKDIEL